MKSMATDRFFFCGRLTRRTHPLNKLDRVTTGNYTIWPLVVLCYSECYNLKLLNYVVPSVLASNFFKLYSALNGSSKKGYEGTLGVFLW